MMPKWTGLSLVLITSAVVLLSSCKDKPTNIYDPLPTSEANPTSISVDNDITRLREITSREPDNLNAWIMLGNLLMDTGRFREASDAYGRALEMDPKNIDVRVDMGTCFRNAGEPGAAVAEYRKALEYDRSHAYAHKNLGVVLVYDLGRIE